jgi:hypothetical protein
MKDATLDPKIPPPADVCIRFVDRQRRDPFGFEVSEYLRAIPYELAKPLIGDAKVTEAEWNKAHDIRSREDAIRVMCEYAAFAWEKANGCRGISAQRTIMHYIAWTWLAGDAEFSAEIEQQFMTDYHHYGKPILEAICDRYGINWRALDNGHRTDVDDT